MKMILSAAILFSTSLLFCSKTSFCQKNKQKPIDSVLEANSEKWKVKLHRPMFGMGKPEFGPYTTIDLNKLDSPVLRTRTKDGSYTAASYDLGDGWDWDFSKYQTVQKRKAYNMLVGAGSDTTELLFSVYSISKEKSLTFFGELMSKNDEGKNLTLGYRIIISGIGTAGYDSLPWRFFLEDSFGRKEEAIPSETTRFTSGYIITSNDSLFTEPIVNQIGSRDSKFFLEWQTGIFVNSIKNNHIAAIKFGTPGDLSNPFYVWIRNDLPPLQRHAIASAFALLISAKTKQ